MKKSVLYSVAVLMVGTAAVSAKEPIYCAGDCAVLKINAEFARCFLDVAADQTLVTAREDGLLEIPLVSCADYEQAVSEAQSAAPASIACELDILCKKRMEKEMAAQRIRDIREKSETTVIVDAARLSCLREREYERFSGLEDDGITWTTFDFYPCNA